MLYEKIGFLRFKIGKCRVCGFGCVEKRRFYQTLNPLNKKVNGELKTEKDILEEEELNYSVWASEPVKHKKCKDEEIK